MTTLKIHIKIFDLPEIIYLLNPTLFLSVHCFINQIQDKMKIAISIENSLLILCPITIIDDLNLIKAGDKIRIMYRDEYD